MFWSDFNKGIHYLLSVTLTKPFLDGVSFPNEFRNTHKSSRQQISLFSSLFHSLYVYVSLSWRAILVDFMRHALWTVNLRNRRTNEKSKYRKIITISINHICHGCERHDKNIHIFVISLLFSISNRSIQLQIHCESVWFVFCSHLFLWFWIDNELARRQRQRRMRQKKIDDSFEEWRAHDTKKKTIAKNKSPLIIVRHLLSSYVHNWK